jgi:thiol-disulfide isomerase/thioredoxin
VTGRRVTAALAVALLAVSALAGCGSDGTTASSDGTITILPAGKRGDPVALAGNTLEGAPLDLATMRGKVVVLNVWGSWCPPCRKEAPDLQRAYEQLRPKGVEFVGIDFNDQSPSQAVAFQRTFGITYPSLADDGGKALLSLRGAVSAATIPSTLVLDTQGRIAVRVSSTVTTATLVDLVDGVLSGGATP